MQREIEMRYFWVPLSIGIFVLFCPAVAKAKPTPQEINRIETATHIFNQLPGRIPSNILNNAKGIVVIPGVLRAGFIYGGEFGGGVMVSRLPDGSWSPPAFVSLGGASFGLQMGFEVRDYVLVFNTARSMEYIENGWLKLGGDASVAAGPVGGNVEISTDLPQVYSYRSNFGAFIGATVGGSILSLDYGSNRDLYGVSDPLKMDAKGIPGPALRFTCEVTRATGGQTEVCG
jgi:lipid-binding SYLF domain-containing protein